MNTRLAVLDLFLKELGQNAVIHSKDDRLRLQKSVYLGQLSGVDLGYRYNWYVHGPYSPSLTQDYYALAAQPDSEKAAYNERSLNDQTLAKLASAKQLFEVPEEVPLALQNWLELLSSWHYLRKVNKYDEEQALEKLQSEKPHVYKFSQAADKALKDAEFM